MDQATRILRVGIVHGDRIVEERLFRRPQAVTIGQAPGNTFVFPLPGFPRSHELLARAGGSYALTFPRGLAGKVSTGDDIFDLDELIEQGDARPRDGAFHYPLTLETRGRVRLGDLTVLFQFVTPPPAVPRLRLPAGARLGWWQRMDVAYVTWLLLSTLMVAAPAAYLHAWYDSRGRYLATRSRVSPLLREDLEPPLVAHLERPTVESPETPDERAEAPAPAPAPTPVAKPDKPRKPTPPAAATAGGGLPVAKAEPGKKALEHVRDTTLLKFVTGGADGGSAVMSGVPASRLAEVWTFAGGATTAQAGDVVEFRGTPRLPGYVAAGGPPRRPGPLAIAAVDAPTRGRELELRAVVRGDTSEGAGAGRLDKAAVTQVFKRRQGALKHCYEKQLKRTPTLAGKVRFTFTIGPAGRVIALSIVDDTAGSAELTRCIAERVREWRFPEPAGGAVTFVHTLVLAPG